MAKEPMSAVDSAWLRMEDPTNLMMVSGVLTFKQPLNFEHLLAILKHRFLKYDRFRQRVVQSRRGLKTAYWEFDPYFDINSHIQRVALPAPHNQEVLQTMCSNLASRPLDFSKPLWQLHYIENYGKGCAIMVRLHHCIADGMALVGVLLSLTDMSAHSPWPKPSSEEETDAKEGSLLGKALGKLVRPAASAMSMARQVTDKLIHESREVWVNPSRMLELAQQGADVSIATSRMVLRMPDPNTLFKGDLGVAKRVAWSRPLPLKDIKAIKNVTGTTVNDVLVTALTGGLRRYMENRGELVAGLNFRAAIPVNLRTPEEMNQLGNKFGLVFLSLPVGIDDTLERLAEVQKRMNALKDSPEAVVALGILNMMGATPSEVQNMVVSLFATKTTAVMTNVPGPRIPLYLAGQEIDNIMFWVPQSGRVGLGISILSYAGKVFLGVVTDAGLVPDPEKIIDGFYTEYEEMMELVQQVETIAEMEEMVKEMETQFNPLEDNN